MEVGDARASGLGTACGCNDLCRVIHNQRRNVGWCCSSRKAAWRPGSACAAMAAGGRRAKGTAAIQAAIDARAAVRCWCRRAFTGGPDNCYDDALCPNVEKLTVTWSAMASSVTGHGLRRCSGSCAYGRRRGGPAERCGPNAIARAAGSRARERAAEQGCRALTAPATRRPA